MMHVRCPHCQNAIELINEAELSDVDCPSCGSSFNLLGDSETQSLPRSAKKVIGHFELTDRVGVGAFGSVWKAKDVRLDRIVAVKIPRKEQLAPDESEAFLREARAAAQLKHPSIVAVHEVGRQDDTIYIVSDFVDGASVADHLSSHPFSNRESASLCLKIAEALQHAHQQGVIHRDLKPSNVMLDADNNPHVMDFGLAKREAGEITMTVEGRVLGTPAYMSPEQAAGEAHNTDGRTDIYSLGVILFELLTAELPFRGNTRMLIHQVLHDEPPSPRKFNANIDRDLETICLKCLEKEQDKRYASSQDMANDLACFLKGEPIKARPIGPFDRTWRWAKRHRAIASSLAIALLILSTTTTVGFISAGIFRGQVNDAKADLQNTEQRRDEARKMMNRAKTELTKAEAEMDHAKVETEMAKNASDKARMEQIKAEASMQKARVMEINAIKASKQANAMLMDAKE